MQSKQESKGEVADVLKSMKQQILLDAISDPKYTAVQTVEVKMQTEEMATKTLNEDIGFDFSAK